MKQIKMKAIAIAALCATSGMANAAIQTAGTGNGELFFSIWDNVSQTSYTRDLGINLNSFTPAVATALGAPVIFTPDTTLTTLLAGILPSSFSALTWNVAAMDALQANRYLTTGAQTIAAPASTFTLNQFNDNADTYIANVNDDPGHVNNANGSTVVNAANDANGFAGSALWGSNWSGNAGFSNSSTIGNSLFFHMLTGGTTSGAAVTSARYENAFGDSTWTLSNDGTLTYANASPAAVPVPAAVWLLGSGLIGVVGVARRRRQTA